MPLVTYAIEKQFLKTKNKRKVWYIGYGYIDVEVPDAVAAFLEEDDKRERRYNWKTKKQLEAANIKFVFSLDAQLTAEAEDNFAELIEDVIHPENRNPLDIMIQNEDNAALDLEYTSTMTKKQHEVFRLYNEGYNNTEVAKLLGLDESSVRERLHMAFRTVVGAHLIHSNKGIFQSLQAELISHYGNTLPIHKFNGYLGTLFMNRLSIIRRDQLEMVNFVLETDYDAAVKKYFSDFLTKTPENP